MNFKPLLLSLSRTTLGSRGREQHPGLCPPAASPGTPRKSPRSLCHNPRHATPSHGDKWGSHPGEVETSGSPPPPLAPCSSWLGWLCSSTRRWSRSMLSKFGHLCRGGDRGDHPHLARAQAFTLKPGHACFEGLLSPTPSSFSTQAQPPPALSFLHSFPPFLIARPQLPETATRAMSYSGESPRGHQTGMSPPRARVHHGTLSHGQ